MLLEAPYRLPYSPYSRDNPALNVSILPRLRNYFKVSSSARTGDKGAPTRRRQINKPKFRGVYQTAFKASRTEYTDPIALTLQVLLGLPIWSQTSPNPQSPENHLLFHSRSFIFSRMSNKWDHLKHRLLSLTPFP